MAASCGCFYIVRYFTAPFSSSFQMGVSAPAFLKKAFRSLFRAIISSTAFIAWSLAQILPSEVEHINLKKRKHERP